MIYLIETTLPLIYRLYVLCEELLPMHMECSLLYDDNGTHIFPELSVTLYFRQNNRTIISPDSVIKSMSPHLTNCFWYQALPPIGNFLTSNQSPPQYPESLYHLQSQSSILCYPLATSFLLKRWRMSRVRKNNFL